MKIILTEFYKKERNTNLDMKRVFPHARSLLRWWWWWVLETHPTE
jgi:hypothetical protein